jgi:electron transfer flavoprotein alpha subunit
MRVIDQGDRDTFSNVWVVAEALSGRVQPVTHELLGAARALADARKSKVWAVVIGHGLSEDARSLFACGADTVILADDDRLSGFRDEAEAAILSRLIRAYRPEIILGAATARGRALIPRVAVLTVSGLTADCTGLAIDPENGDLLQTRPAFGGNIMATIRCPDHRPQMSTIRPHVMKAPLPQPGRGGEVIRAEVLDSDFINAKEIIQAVHGAEEEVNLSEARVIVAGGRGVGGPKGFELLRGLAHALGGAVGASRSAVDAGWISYAHQVGQTGQTVQTDVYIACGISGQIQHLVGMQSCETIIAIDTNPDTPMMQIADIAIVGDLFKVVPAIIRELEKNT